MQRSSQGRQGSHHGGGTGGFLSSLFNTLQAAFQESEDEESTSSGRTEFSQRPPHTHLNRDRISSTPFPSTTYSYEEMKRPRGQSEEGRRPFPSTPYQLFPVSPLPAKRSFNEGGDAPEALPLPSSHMSSSSTRRYYSADAIQPDPPPPPTISRSDDYSRLVPRRFLLSDWNEPGGHSFPVFSSVSRSGDRNEHEEVATMERRRRIRSELCKDFISSSNQEDLLPTFTRGQSAPTLPLRLPSYPSSSFSSVHPQSLSRRQSSSTSSQSSLPQLNPMKSTSSTLRLNYSTHSSGTTTEGATAKIPPQFRVDIRNALSLRERPKGGDESALPTTTSDVTPSFEQTKTEQPAPSIRKEFGYYCTVPGIIPGLATFSSRTITFEPDPRGHHAAVMGVGAFQVFIDMKDVLEAGAAFLPSDIEESAGDSNVAGYLQLALRTLNSRSPIPSSKSFFGSLKFKKASNHHASKKTTTTSLTSPKFLVSKAVSDDAVSTMYQVAHTDSEAEGSRSFQTPPLRGARRLAVRRPYLPPSAVSVPPSVQDGNEEGEEDQNEQKLLLSVRKKTKGSRWTSVGSLRRFTQKTFSGFSTYRGPSKGSSAKIASYNREEIVSSSCSSRSSSVSSTSSSKSSASLERERRTKVHSLNPQNQEVAVHRLSSVSGPKKTLHTPLPPSPCFLHPFDEKNLMKAISLYTSSSPQLNTVEEPHTPRANDREEEAVPSDDEEGDTACEKKMKIQHEEESLNIEKKEKTLVLDNAKARSPLFVVFKFSNKQVVRDLTEFVVDALEMRNLSQQDDLSSPSFTYVPYDSNEFLKTLTQYPHRSPSIVCPVQKSSSVNPVDIAGRLVESFFSSFSSGKKSPNIPVEDNRFGKNKNEAALERISLFIPTYEYPQGASDLLDDYFASEIATALPPTLSCRTWRLTFCSRLHGVSFQTFFRLVKDVCPVFLLIKDVGGTVFGAFSSEPIHQSTKYYGSGESFVFTFKQSAESKASKDNQIQVFRWSSSNPFFFFTNTKCIAIGGGGHYAITIDGSFLRGSSSACATFNSPSLSTTEDFVIRDFQVWSFDEL